jgi:hypothetical protein
VIGAPIMLGLTRYRMRAALRLAPPRPTPGVAAPSAAPLDPGRRVLTRASGRFALVMVAAVLFAASVLFVT